MWIFQCKNHSKGVKEDTAEPSVTKKHEKHLNHCTKKVLKHKNIEVEVLNRLTDVNRPFQRMPICVFQVLWKRVYVFDFGPYLNINTLYGLSCWVHFGGEWADKPYWRSVTSTCAVMKVAERWSRSWTGVQCVGASVFIRSQLYSSVTLKRPVNIWVWVSRSVECQPLQRLLLSLSWGS